MEFRQVRWGLAVAGVLGAEAALILAAFAWVAVYSYFVNPGHDASFYERYAQTTVPYVAMLLGIPVFFLACRWIGLRAPSSAKATALAVFGLFCLIDITTTLAAPNPGVALWFTAANIPLKLVSCLWGARSVEKPA